ncbi:hypothetical protein ACFLYW_04125 [Thermodesulfobacteriota bacterium]
MENVVPAYYAPYGFMPGRQTDSLQNLSAASVGEIASVLLLCKTL